MRLIPRTYDGDSKRIRVAATTSRGNVTTVRFSWISEQAYRCHLENEFLLRAFKRVRESK